MSKCLVVGVEVRSYSDKNTGELKYFRELHVVHDEPKRKVDGLRGQRCEVIVARFDVSDIQPRKRYELEYETRNFRGVSQAILVGLEPLD